LSLINPPNLHPERCKQGCIIFTHTDADCHNHHRSVRELALASFRRQAIAGFAVVNSLNASALVPTLYSDVSASIDHKLTALAAHRTQLAAGRICLDDIRDFNRLEKPSTKLIFEEPFDLSLQYGAPSADALQAILDDIGLLRAEKARERGHQVASRDQLAAVALR
jgi:hypothetical protein